MAGVYGPEREGTLDPARLSFWLEDVQRCEADVAEDVSRLAFACEAEATSDELGRASRGLYRAYCQVALIEDVRRLAYCRARLADPGDKYGVTPAGRKEAAKVTAAVRGVVRKSDTCAGGSWHRVTRDR